MKRKKHFRFLHELHDNKTVMKWVIYVIETIVSAFVGALIAFVFGANYVAVIIAFAVLMAFLIAVSLVIVVLENQVSMLSIMSRSIDDGRYEDAIKFGMAISPILFSTDKNSKRVKVGEKTNEACDRLREQKYSANIRINGQTLDEIQARVLIDDLGWSLHLCNDDNRAEHNIIQGINFSRRAASQLINEGEQVEKLKSYMSVILKGYRHLTGIYYSNAEKNDKAAYFENITKLILSGGKALQQRNLCSENKKGCQFPGLICLETDAQNNCLLDSAIWLYYSGLDKESTGDYSESAVKAFLGSSPTEAVDLSDIKLDITIFSKLSKDDRLALLSEQSYAWGRNIIKKLKALRYTKKTGHYIADCEITCMLKEAEIYVLMYYYGKKLPDKRAEIPFGQYEKLIADKANPTKTELRTISLLGEIELESLALVARDNKNQRIASVKRDIENAADLCAASRGDLYVRNLCHLMELLLIKFNTTYRYSSFEECKQNVGEYIHNLDQIYSGIKPYVAKSDIDKDVYHEIRTELQQIKKMRAKKIRRARISEYQSDWLISVINGKSAIHTAVDSKDYLYESDELQKEVKSIAEKWKVHTDGTSDEHKVNA